MLMRNLFLVIVLVNLAFAAWSAWFAAPANMGRPSDDGLPALTLVSELPADLRSSGVVAEEADTATEDVPVPPADVVAPAVVSDARLDAGAAGDEPAVDAGVQAAAKCTSVGPFRELSQAATAAAALRNAGYQPVQRVVEGDVWSGYWVYLPAIATEEQANDTLAKIREGVREARIPDAYVIRNSDSGNLVSLGVFSEISGVSRLRDEVRALGFEPQVVDRTRRATVYWIDVVLAPDQTLDFDALQPPGRIIRLEQRTCEAPA
jgi:cell division septation protein DedD